MARGTIITIAACGLLIACGEGEGSPMTGGIASVGAPIESAGMEADDDDDDDDDDDYPSDDGSDYPPDDNDDGYPPGDDGDDPPGDDDDDDDAEDTEGGTDGGDPGDDGDDHGGSDGGHDDGSRDDGSHDDGSHDDGGDGSGSADDWSGDFDGEFDGDSYSELFLQIDCTDNVLSGTAIDDFGSSIIDGVCDDDAVSFEKIYVDGDFIGSFNDYVGIRIAGHLEGTWSNTALSGTWEADEV